MVLGIVLALITGVLVLAAVAFIWLGLFPSLALLLVCAPLGVFAAKLIRKGRPAGTR